jgi:release factor glutamine methyltransferase
VLKGFVSGFQLWQWREMAREDALAAEMAPGEVDWFLEALTRLDRLSLRLGSFRDRERLELPISLEELTQLWQQRIHDRVPLQYLTRTAPWRHFELVVSPAVLIPRPETEELIELAVTACQDSELKQGHWADLGTGSGAIALGLATAFPEAIIHAIDQSEAALEIARENARKLDFDDQIIFDSGNWFTPLDGFKGQISGMISNPPYIPTHLIPQLQPEVSQHEPHLALDGGRDGLDCIRHLVKTAPTYVRPGGIWAIEMMAGQGEAVTELLHQQGDYEKIQVFPDLAGIDRFVLAYIGCLRGV